MIWEGFPEESGLEKITLEGEREGKRKIKPKELHVKRPGGGTLETSGGILTTSQGFSFLVFWELGSFVDPSCSWGGIAGWQNNLKGLRGVSQDPSPIPNLLKQMSIEASRGRTCVHSAFAYLAGSQLSNGSSAAGPG